MKHGPGRHGRLLVQPGRVHLDLPWVSPMKTVLELIGLMAVGMIVAVLASGSISGLSADGLAAGKSQVAFGSFAGGLATGLILATMSRLGWSAVPRRIVQFLVGNANGFKLASLAACCLAVIVFY
jgi:hypothetical protein